MRRVAVFLCCVLVLSARAASPQGVPLGPEFRINNYLPHFQENPWVTTNGAGSLVVVWSSFNQDGFDVDVFGRRYESSGPAQGPEFRVNTYTTGGGKTTPSVASDSDGNFVVVWKALDGASFGVFGKRYDSSGNPVGPEFRVNTFTTDYQGRPVVVSDAAGNFVVVWHSLAQDGSDSGVFGQRFASSGSPLGPEFRVNTYTVGYQRSPRVALDAVGNFVVVWAGATPDGPPSSIFGQRFSSTGVPLGPEFRVNTYTTDRQVGPSVASDPAGTFVVAWESFSQDGSQYGIFAQRFASSGSPVGPEFRVNTYTTGTQRDAAVASDAGGNFVVVWTSAISSTDVEGQRYDASGLPLGSEFRVNTTTYEFQRLPSVAVEPLGNFLVVWQGGSVIDPDIFGQRYSQIFPAELLDFHLE